MRASSNISQTESDEIVKKFSNTMQNRSEAGKMICLTENTPSSTTSEFMGFSTYSQQQHGQMKNKTNRIQESIRQIATPKIPHQSSSSRNSEIGYMNMNPPSHTSLSLRQQNTQQNNLFHNYSGIHTPVKDMELKQITSKYLNTNIPLNTNSFANGKPPLSGISQSGLSSHLQTETGSQNNYDLKRLLSPTIDRTNMQPNQGNSSQIRFLSPGPVLESFTPKSEMNEYFNTELHKRPSKNYTVQKREISLNDQLLRNQTSDSFLSTQNKTQEDNKFRVKTPQQLDFNRKELNIIGGQSYSNLRLDTSHSDSNSIVPLTTKLKSESDLDLIKQISTPKITQIVSSKGGNNFSGSAFTSPLTKKLSHNFNSENKGFDIKSYKLNDISKNNEINRVDTKMSQQITRDRDLSLGSSQVHVKGFQVNEVGSNRNIDMQGITNMQPFGNIKVNSVTDIQQEPMVLKRGSSVDQSSQINGNKSKSYSTNQLFSKTLQSTNGLSNTQKITTLQNLFSSSNLDNNISISQSAQNELQNNILPVHLMQERTSRKIQIMNQINIKQFTISDEFKLAFA